MAITTDQVKELRQKTGVSVMQCKLALEEAGGDTEKALIILRKKGNKVAEKKASRDLNSGVVSSYIHGNSSVGSMVELFCETDFVAKNEEFKALAYDIAMQIAATEEEFLKTEKVLLEQAFIKEPKTTIESLIKSATQKFGERIEIGKFVKYSI